MIPVRHPLGRFDSMTPLLLPVTVAGVLAATMGAAPALWWPVAAGLVALALWRVLRRV